MKRIFIAGPYSADNVITVLDNIREGMRLSTEVLLLGYSPFCPWLDFHYQLMLRRHEKLSVEDYYRYSLDWLEVSDAVLVISRWIGSKGTKAEIDRAVELQIPVYFNIHDLLRDDGKDTD